MSIHTEDLRAETAGATAPAPRRWLTLVILCLAVFVVAVDGTIVNVALPTFVRELRASTSELQWIVDAFILVFAGLLIAAGSLGDRLGRKAVMQAGLALFAVFSAFAAFSTTPAQIIGWRAAMGLGAALIFPATLAILVNVFTEARERATAISIWAATAGLAVALGPVSGGLLLEHFWWGSVFLFNVPVVALAMVAIALFVPGSRDTSLTRFDPVGTLLSIAAIGLFVYTVIEAPHHGWASTRSLAGFAAAVGLLAAFIAWEHRSDHPMLDVSVFADLRFSAASASITFAFFALFGFVFVVTQYFQFVRGYGTLEAGVRTVPFALFCGVASPLAAPLTARFGTKVIVATGLLSMAAGFALSTTAGAESTYWLIVAAMFFMGGGLGLVQAPATDSIMGSLPASKAGVGSAVNDTARELGATLGIAVVGSVFSSIYTGHLVDALAGTPLPPEALAAAQQSTGAGLAVADQATALAGPAAGGMVRDAVVGAFLDGWHTGAWVSAGIVTVGAVVAARFLPARPTADAAAAADLTPRPATTGA